MLSQSDITLIKNLMHLKSDAEIATIIGKSADEVHTHINKITGFVKARKRRISFENDVVKQREENSQQREQRRQERDLRRLQKRTEQNKKYNEERQARSEKRKQEKEALRLQKIADREERKKARELEKLNKKARTKRTKPVTQNAFDRDRLQKRSSEVIKYEIRQNKKKEIVYPDRNVDYSRKVLIRVNARTCIYINPGEDPQQAIDNYSRLHPVKDYKNIV